MNWTANNIRKFQRTYVDPHRLRHGDGAWQIIRLTFKDFSEYSQEMLDYCIQDVVVTTKLWKQIVNQNYQESSLKLEHDFALAINRQVRAGFPFDVDACLDLVDVLTNKTRRTGVHI
jgi:hypothetical protein